jgi:phosphomannomutase
LEQHDNCGAINIKELSKTINKEKADIGFAFDGDGDRLVLVDRNGQILWGDQILAILSKEVLEENPGAIVIADVKSSEALFEEIKKLGGQPRMARTGHSIIKQEMVNTQAMLAGEMSGHIFFADKYFGFDDALYAAVRLLGVVSRSGKKMCPLISPANIA